MNTFEIVVAIIFSVVFLIIIGVPFWYRERENGRRVWKYREIWLGDCHSDSRGIMFCRLQGKRRYRYPY